MRIPNISILFRKNTGALSISVDDATDMFVQGLIKGYFAGIAQNYINDPYIGPLEVRLKQQMERFLLTEANYNRLYFSDRNKEWTYQEELKNDQ